MLNCEQISDILNDVAMVRKNNVFDVLSGHGV